MLKKILIKLYFLLWVSLVYSQEHEPVRWRFTANKTGDKTFEICATANIQHPWHIYSQDTPEGAALPTSFSFNNNPLLIFEGKPVEKGNVIKVKEKKNILKYYNQKVVFVQVIKLKTNAKTNIIGKVDYMACTNERCLPPASREFSVSLIP